MTCVLSVPDLREYVRVHLSFMTSISDLDMFLEKSCMPLYRIHVTMKFCLVIEENLEWKCQNVEKEKYNEKWNEKWK